jgi:ubiquinone/menaquinone biosynthesis C-methylase UbiE
MTKDIYNKKYYQASNRFQSEDKRLKYFVDLIKSYKPVRVLDVGCGIGYLVKRLNKDGVETIGIDFSEELNDFWGDDDNFFEMDAKQINFPDQSFDVVFSSDFFEHLEEGDIDKVASEMKRIGKHIIAFVADNIGEVLAGRQLRYHPTHKPLMWWKNKLEGIEVYSSHI